MLEPVEVSTDTPSATRIPVLKLFEDFEQKLSKTENSDQGWIQASVFIDDAYTQLNGVLIESKADKRLNGMFTTLLNKTKLSGQACELAALKNTAAFIRKSYDALKKKEGRWTKFFKIVTTTLGWTGFATCVAGPTIGLLYLGVISWTLHYGLKLIWVAIYAVCVGAACIIALTTLKQDIPFIKVLSLIITLASVINIIGYFDMNESYRMPTIWNRPPGVYFIVSKLNRNLESAFKVEDVTYNCGGDNLHTCILHEAYTYDKSDMSSAPGVPRVDYFNSAVINGFPLIGHLNRTLDKTAFGRRVQVDYVIALGALVENPVKDLDSLTGPLEKAISLFNPSDIDKILPSHTTQVNIEAKGSLLETRKAINVEMKRIENEYREREQKITALIHDSFMNYIESAQYSTKKFIKITKVQITG